MKFNFKKVASVLASAVMLGSTVGIAAAANFPAPFVSGGNADVAVVVGGSAASSDYLAAVDLGQGLQVELAKQTAVSGSSSGASATGGDAVNVATSSQRIYSNSALNAARSVLTAQELPTLLADGTAYDNSGTSYDYTQALNLGGAAMTFDKSGESIDPLLYLNVGTTSGNFYNYTLTLTKTLNVSSSNVVGYADFTIFGNKYTVGANSDSTTLYLYGSGTEVAVSGGETKTVTVVGTEHTITLVTTSSATAGTLEVDGVRKAVTKGNSYKFAGGFEVYIKDVVHPTVSGDPRDMQLLLGATSLHFKSGEEVRAGSDDKIIDNTKAIITGTAGVGISKLVVEQAAADSTGDYISAGQSYTDRVFGNLRVEVADVIPALDSATRDSVKVVANELSSKVTFTSNLAGSAGEKTLQYALDTDNVADTTLNAVNLTYQAGAKISVVEGENLLKDDYVVVNAGDKGRILRVSSISSNSSADNKVTLIDVISGDEVVFTTGLGPTASNNLDGQTYYVAANNRETVAQASRTVNVTWGAGAAAGTPGTYTTLFPRIKLKNGGWLAILTTTAVSNATSYALPGEFLLSDYETGAVLGYNNNSLRVGSVVGAINWSVLPTGTSTSAGILDGLSARGSIVDCNFNATFGPAILLYEEKTLASSNGNAICIPLGTEGTSPKTPSVSSPVFTDGVGSFKQLNSDTDTSQAVDLYGTFLEKNTADQNMVALTYPDEQMYVDAVFASAGATVTPGSSSGGAVAELGSVTVKDSEVSQVSAKNLVVVGGSCINTVAAKMLGSDSPVCGAGFTTAAGAGAGEFLVSTMVSPYASGKVATLVAGYEASDTANAVKYLTKQTVDTSVGKKYKGTSATSAQLVTA